MTKDIIALRPILQAIIQYYKKFLNLYIDTPPPAEAPLFQRGTGPVQIRLWFPSGRGVAEGRGVDSVLFVLCTREFKKRSADALLF
jgi:hypothetical protein